VHCQLKNILYFCRPFRGDKIRDNIPQQCGRDHRHNETKNSKETGAAGPRSIDFLSVLTDLESSVLSFNYSLKPARTLKKHLFFKNTLYNEEFDPGSG
jgi:hypothetical protein